MDLREDACAYPLHQPQVARGTGTEVERQCLPLATGAHSVEDAGHRDSVRHTRSSAARLRALRRQQRFDALPQIVGDVEEVLLHGASESIPRTRLTEVLGRALRVWWISALMLNA